jgi:peroxiredoxin
MLLSTRRQLLTTLIAASPALAIPAVPRPAGNFTFHLPDGSTKSLSQYRGKVVCLMFVYTTCPHCQHASQVMTQLFNEYASRGFQPLAVAFNPDADTLVPDFVRTYGIGFPVGAEPQAVALQYLGISLMERYVVPQILWIDRNGEIRSQTPPMGDEKLLEESYWRSELESLLKEPARKNARSPHRTSAR